MLGGIFTFSQITTWYATLNRTPLSPPNWLFSPMWITLFALMGISFYNMWKNKKWNEWKTGRILFFIQLGLNFLWSFIFFGNQSILFGAIEIIFLWFFILFTIIEFREKSKLSAYLMIPYLAWVTIATLLNISILFFN